MPASTIEEGRESEHSVHIKVKTWGRKKANPKPLFTQRS